MIIKGEAPNRELVVVGDDEGLQLEAAGGMIVNGGSILLVM